MIQVKEGVYFSEEALQKSREAYAMPKKKTLWPAFIKHLQKSGASPTEEELFNMYREFIKEHKHKGSEVS